MYIYIYAHRVARQPGGHATCVERADGREQRRVDARLEPLLEQLARDAQCSGDSVSEGGGEGDEHQRRGERCVGEEERLGGLVDGEVGRPAVGGTGRGRWGRLVDKVGTCVCDRLWTLKWSYPRRRMVRGAGAGSER